MAKWQAKKFQLPNHNFETTAIKFDDGRSGLCYHGSAIWDDGGGWEDFIESDWNEVWKKGRPCSFQDLPPDMRIACPACGAKIQPEDAECSKCGVIFSKIKEEPVKTKTPEESATETPPSKMLNIGLVSLVLIIAGFFIYSVLKPEPQTPPRPGEPTETQPFTGDAERAFSQSEGSQDIPTDQSDIAAGDENNSLPTEPESEAMEPEQSYSHIDLDDLETAGRQLQEEIAGLNQEGVQINETLNNPASTPEELQQARNNKVRYEHKARELGQLIKEFNARNQNAP